MIIHDFVNLFFPKTCVSCGQGLVHDEGFLCSLCRIQLPTTGMHSYSPNEMEIRCIGMVPIERAFSYLKFVKNGITQSILHELKYNHNPKSGVILGQWFGAELKENDCCSFDLILPVPLHAEKERQRGYNQSDHIARGMAKAVGIPCKTDLLVRTKFTETQTRKSRLQRWENMEDVFEVRDSEEIKHKRILLVDDVITTGATLCSCAQKLIDEGCGAISLATLAIAQ